MVTVPQKTMLSLVADFRDDTKAAAAWDRVQQLVAGGEATLVAAFAPRGAQSQSLVSESVEELRYPTEFVPPNLPDKMPETDAAAALKAWPVVGITPTAFVVQKVGQMVKLTAGVSEDGRWIDVEAAPQDVRFLEWVKFDAGELANGDHLTVQQPKFHFMTDTLNLRMKNGEKILAGVHKVPGGGGSYELFLLEVSARRVAEKR